LFVFLFAAAAGVEGKLPVKSAFKAGCAFVHVNGLVGST